MRILLACFAAALVFFISQSANARDLTFFVVSDTHYGLSPEGDRRVPLLVDKMNQLPGTVYPAELSGTVAKPRGVIHIGDITNDGKKEQWELFLHDYGLNGKGGRLLWPVYETFGNHDGGTDLPIRKGIRQRNPQRLGLRSISPNGLHYSWDWDGVHFVNCGISPGSTIHPYDPEQSIEFLGNDLKQAVGNSGNPVILFHHFGFDKDHSLRWWPEEWRTAYLEKIKDYNVIGILHGHAHKSMIYQWNGYDIYHPPHFQQKPPKETGPVMHGFFVFRITDHEVQVAERKLDDTWGLISRKTFSSTAPSTTTPALP